MPIADLTALVDESTQNVFQLQGLAAAYNVLLGGVPTIDGFTYLINENNDTNFGSKTAETDGPVFNEENIFINTINSLYQGNPTAKAAFDAIVGGGATLSDKLELVYNEIIPAADRSDAGLLFFKSQSQFYIDRAAELGIEGTNGAALVAFASLTKIAVDNDIGGLGDSINDLVAAVADGSAMIPQDGDMLTPIEIADGGNFDGDDIGSGQIFTLTENSDTIQGQPGNLVGSAGSVDTGGDDTIIAGVSVSGGVASNNLGSGDLIDGGEGFDTLRVIDSAGSLLTPTISNVERFDVQALGTPASMDLTNATGVEQIWNFRSSADVTVSEIQAPAALGVEGSDNRFNAVFANGVSLGGELNLFTVDAGTGPAGGPADIASIYVNTDDYANIATVNVTANGGDSFLEIDIDASTTPGATTANPTTLNIMGDSGLFLREANGEGETNLLTTVDSTGLTGWLDLDLSANDQDIMFSGGPGDTTLLTGNGNSTITTGDGDDLIVSGTGDNTITTNGGMDSVTVGIGSNVIDTGTEADLVDITAGGDQTVTLGEGDDILRAGTALSDADAVEAGDGVDELVVDVNSAGLFTANGDVDAVVNGFEKIELTGTIGEDAVVTVDLDNIDDISDVTVSATIAAGTGVAETQTFQVLTGANMTGGIITVDGLTIEVPSSMAGLSPADVAALIAAAEADLIANNPEIASVTADGDVVTVQYTLAAGDVAAPIVVSQNASVAADAGGIVFGAVDQVTNPGTDGTDEGQTIEVTGPASANGTITVTVDGNAVNVDVFNGQSTDVIAANIRTAINNAALTGITAVVAGALVTVTYDEDLGDVAIATVAAAGTGVATTVTDDVPQGVASAAETQTFTVTGTGDADGGYVTVGGVEVAVAALATNDQVGLAIVAAEAEIIAASGGEIVSVNYNTGTDTITIVYDEEAGDVAAIAIDADVTGDDTTGVSFGAVSVDEGVTGGVDGILNLDNMASGGTVRLAGDNDGLIVVNLTDPSATDDSLNLVLENADVGSGVVRADGVETLNVMTEVDSATASVFNFFAPDVETLIVTGQSGVDFGINDLVVDLTNLTLVDASGLDIAVTDQGISIETDNTSGTTFIGSAGVDNFLGDVGADTMTGGTGEDTFFYTTADQSRGANADTITDFLTGEDTINLDAIEDILEVNNSLPLGSVDTTYLGEVNSLAAANTALAAMGGTGNLQAVFDTSVSQLYVDVNDNGSIDGGDMIINLTGVTTLDQADFA